MEIKDFRNYYQKLNEVEKKYSPKELYYEGDFSFLTDGVRVSVVGSRKASKNGIKRAEIITKKLVELNFIVVSGLAEGIDTVAHKTAIQNKGKTIAVLGTPLDKSYPSSNHDLLKYIKKNHLVISQFPIGYPFQPKNFPIRNKTMALISDATIIIEATEKSGTRHQGWEALRLGREVIILENLVKDKSLTWPKEMLEYGARIANRDSIDNLLKEIPSLTMKSDYAF